MRAVSAIRAAPGFAAVLPTHRTSHSHAQAQQARYGSRGDSTTRSDDIDDETQIENDDDGVTAAWEDASAFSDRTASKSSLFPTQQTPEEPSVLFEFFVLLCFYHGANTVSEFWAKVLADPLVEAEKIDEAEEAEGETGEEGSSHPDTDKGSSVGRTASARFELHEEEEEEAAFASRVTTIDVADCYVGARMLLALADLCRVRRVSQPTRRRHLSAAQLKKLAVAVTAVAPLWNVRRDESAAKAEESEMCSLLPLLQTLRLNRLSLDFSEATAAGELHGNKVLLYVLEALQGHPRLQVLDLSGNPIAAALLPALSRLLQSTPSLCTLIVEDTLLTPHDKQMLEAQCELNRLRIQRSGKTPLTAEADAGDVTLSALQTRWTAQTLREVQRALEVGVSAIPWMLGKSTVYVRRYKAATTASKASRASSFVSVASTAVGTVSRGGARRKSMSYATMDGMGMSINSDLTQTFGGSADMTYLCYNAADAAATHAVVAAGGGGSAVWTHECVEVVRAAFLDRQLAQRTVLGGRAAWPNVPLPEDAESGLENSLVHIGGVRGAMRGSTLSSISNSSSGRPSAAALSSSRFLQSIRQQLLPPPQAPTPLSQSGSTGFLTTAEENYHAVCQTQEQQWAYLVGRLLDHLEPLTVGDGEVLYDERDPSSSYVYFCPSEWAESAASVRLSAGGVEVSVLPGQWFGEAEALGCMALFPNAATASPSFSASPFSRASTARVVAPSGAAVTLWALPFPVAFFFLYAPYQQLQRDLMRRTPTSVFAAVHPVHAAAVAVQLTLFHWTRTAATNTTAAAAAQRNGEAARVLCGADFITRHVLLLQEGEFLLRLPRVAAEAGGWGSRPVSGSRPPAAAAVTQEAEERHLLSGNAVVILPLFELDAAARQAGEDGGGELLGSAAADGRPLGKEAALQQFRQQKAAAAAAEKRRVSASVASIAADATGGDAAMSGADDAGGAAAMDVMELRPYPSVAPTAHWRYAAMPNDAFAALNPLLRLALTRHSCVVPAAQS